jgi:hypothetical protein
MYVSSALNVRTLMKLVKYEPSVAGVVAAGVELTVICRVYLKETDGQIWW